MSAIKRGSTEEKGIRDKVNEFVSTADIVLDELQAEETMQSFKERIGDFMDVYIPRVTKDTQEIKKRFQQLKDSIEMGK